MSSGWRWAFIFLVVSAVVTLMWRPGRPSARAAGGACLLLALAALTRSVGVPLLLAALGYLAVTRIGLLRFAVAAIAGLLPLALYATWVRAEDGTFALSQVDGVSLWAWTMTFADCDKIRPPAAEAPLCPNGTDVDAASEYVWAPGSSLDRFTAPGEQAAYDRRKPPPPSDDVRGQLGRCRSAVARMVKHRSPGVELPRRAWSL
jgi:hypothetical protein